MRDTGFENLTGLIRAVSRGCVLPPQEAARNAPPVHVVIHQGNERPWIASVERIRCFAKTVGHHIRMLSPPERHVDVRHERWRRLPQQRPQHVDRLRAPITEHRQRCKRKLRLSCSVSVGDSSSGRAVGSHRGSPPRQGRQGYFGLLLAPLRWRGVGGFWLGCVVLLGLATELGAARCRLALDRVVARPRASECLRGAEPSV